MLFAYYWLPPACQNKDASSVNNATDNTAKPAASANTTAAEAPPKSTLKPGEIPFRGFPTVATTAKASEVVLCPSYDWIQDAATKDPDNVSFIYYAQKMSAPGDLESEVEFLSPGKAKVANAYIIPIPAGQTAKVGDIVLTWWQSGSGMNRAIVVEAADPSEPTVRYLDKAGDKVKVPKYGTTFDDATVTKVDSRNGRVFVKIGIGTEESAIAFGDVMTN